MQNRSLWLHSKPEGLERWQIAACRAACEGIQLSVQLRGDGLVVHPWRIHRSPFTSARSKRQGFLALSSALQLMSVLSSCIQLPLAHLQA